MEANGETRMAMGLGIIQTAMILMPSSILQASGTTVMAMGMVIIGVTALGMKLECQNGRAFSLTVQ